MEIYLLDGQSIQEHLFQLAEKGNKSFSQSLHPGVDHVLGIRIPDLRLLAKRIVRSDWQLYLEQAGTYYMEERTLHGLVLGYVHLDTDIERYLQLVDRFVDVINSWSVCDTFTFAGGKKLVKDHEKRMWAYVMKWMSASREYEIRFGVVMAMRYFMDERYLQKMFCAFSQIRHEGYYVKMAVAWAVSVCFVKFPEATITFLRRNQLDEVTYNKSLQKIVESLRVDTVTKQKIKAMRR